VKTTTQTNQYSNVLTVDTVGGTDTVIIAGNLLPSETLKYSIGLTGDTKVSHFLIGVGYKF
jgi:hypothetical protein